MPDVEGTMTLHQHRKSQRGWLLLAGSLALGALSLGSLVVVDLHRTPHTVAPAQR